MRLAMPAWLSPLGLLNALGGLGDHAETLGLSYGNGARHRLDVYSPLAAKAPVPTIVFFYGGAWEEGERSAYRFVGAALAAQGLLAIIPDYRVYPEVVFPAFLEDAARVVRWAGLHAAEFGGDPGRMVLMGHSAGAHLAAMLAFDGQWLGAHGGDPRRDVRGLVGLAGPYDFLPLRSARLKTIFGPEAGRAASQPINFVEPGCPPAFLATGRDDTVVDPGNASRLAARMRAVGGTADVRLYDHLGHAAILGAMAPVLRPLAPVFRDMMGFISATTEARHTADYMPREVGA